MFEAQDGPTALEKAAQERPDLILLDLWMPVMDGFQVLSKLKEDTATVAIPVVLLTAMPPAQGERDGLQLGASHYISKPWKPQTVELTVRVALRESAGGTGGQGNESDLLSSSTSYRWTAEGPGPQGVIRTAGRLISLEKILGGGIPIRTMTLVEGASTAGKSTLCQHLTYGALTDGHATAYMTSEHTPHSLLAQMSSIGLDASPYQRGRQLSIQPFKKSVGDGDSGPLLTELAREIEGLARKYELIVVDSITNLAAYSQDQGIIGFFSTCKRLCGKAVTTVVVIQPHAVDENMRLRLRSICDNHCNLRSGNLGVKVIRTLEVLKANNVELSRNNTVNFRVEPELGMCVMPMASVWI